MNGSPGSSLNPIGIQGVCPVGWHLPSVAEWNTLTNFLSGENVAGGKMKETGTTHWVNPNIGATNSSLFNGLPGGNRFPYGPFDNLGWYAAWWTATTCSSISAWNRGLEKFSAKISGSSVDQEMGYSIRCVKN